MNEEEVVHLPVHRPVALVVVVVHRRGGVKAVGRRGVGRRRPDPPVQEEGEDHRGVEAVADREVVGGVALPTTTAQLLQQGRHRQQQKKEEGAVVVIRLRR